VPPVHRIEILEALPRDPTPEMVKEADEKRAFEPIAELQAKIAAHKPDPATQALADVLKLWFPAAKWEHVTMAAQMRLSLKKRGYDLEDLLGRDLTNG
jgi:poly-gamma-glutamate capsule biosynthesis protein CapA/YwtB (metallophosphatase superfamily)